MRVDSYGNSRGSRHRAHTMSLILGLIRANKPLHAWRSCSQELVDGAGFSAHMRDFSKVARQIYSQLSHDDVVALVAAEFDSLPAQLRLDLGTLCNGASGSGHVRKNVQKLDRLVGGRLLREADGSVYVNRRVESIDGVRFKRQRVNESAAAAQRKYAAR